MATRRPKVPRATALGTPPGAVRPSTPRGPAPVEAPVADVIAAEFGAGKPAAGKVQAATPDSPKPASGKKANEGSDASPRKKPSSGTTSPVKNSGPAKKAGKASGAPAPAAGRDSDPVPAKAFSGRMLALAVVMIAITIMLAPTVKIFLEKRAEISALEAEISSQKAEQNDLNKQISRWQDPNYVKQQARDRINMVMPGETGYWVFGGEDAAGTPGGRTGSGSTANPENLPWVDALWESIRRSATD